MAAKKKRAGSRTSKSRPKPSAPRTFTFSLPVFIQIQQTFTQEEVESPDDDEPEITQAALNDLANEIKELVQQNFHVTKVSIDADRLDTVFLGRE